MGEYDKILVFAAVKDKEYDSMIHLLAGNITFGRIIVTSVDSKEKGGFRKAGGDILGVYGYSGHGQR